jgi:putative DNA primase/helicase
LVLTSSGGDTSAAVQLLEDLRSLFQSKGVERLTTEEILTHLNAMDERPWPEWRDRGPMTPRQLALILQRFGIGPARWKQERTSQRGYEPEAFQDAFSRYLPPEPTQATPASFHSTYTDTSSGPAKPETAHIRHDKSSSFRAVSGREEEKRHHEGPNQGEPTP